MPSATPKLTFSVHARRNDAHGSEATCKSASIALDTDLAGRVDAFNPAELMMAALAACILKSIERVSPILKFQLRSVAVSLAGVRQDIPPRMESIDYEILIDSDESDHRLRLLHENIQKYGTVYNTLLPGTRIHGVIRRQE